MHLFLIEVVTVGLLTHFAFLKTQAETADVFDFAPDQSLNHDTVAQADAGALHRDGVQMSLDWWRRSNRPALPVRSHLNETAVWRAHHLDD